MMNQFNLWLGAEGCDEVFNIVTSRRLVCGREIQARSSASTEYREPVMIPPISYIGSIYVALGSQAEASTDAKYFFWGIVWEGMLPMMILNVNFAAELEPGRGYRGT